MLEQILTSNEFFQGGLILGLVGGALAYARHVPAQLWKLIKRQFMTTLYVREENLVNWLADWLGEQERETRWFMGRTLPGKEGLEPVIFPGQGFHIIYAHNKKFWIWCDLEENGIQGKIQTFTVQCWGRDAEPLQKVIMDAKNLADERKNGKTVTHINNCWGEWIQLRTCAERHKNSIILPKGQLEDILKDTETFLSSKDSYIARGVPYRRGYLFQGPPGNGKSSLVQILATEFKLPIYVLSLADKDLTDNRLALALGKIPERSILLLEDADRVGIDNSGISISGLLNAIDGSLATEGRLFIVTSNFPEKLDTAIKRAGRIDRTWNFNNPTKDQIATLARRYYTNANNYDIDKISSDLSMGSKIPMSEVQNILSSNNIEDLLSILSSNNNGELKETYAQL